jgi:16S rRNA G527 N7-methylase RsmG
LKLSGVEVIDIRMEDLPESSHGRYAVVTARAFADMQSALKTGLPFLKPGGLMVLSRGPEESIGSPELETAGVLLEKRIDLTLPHSDYKRAIWVFRKNK